MSCSSLFRSELLNLNIGMEICINTSWSRFQRYSDNKDMAGLPFSVQKTPPTHVDFKKRGLQQYTLLPAYGETAHFTIFHN